MPFGFWGEDGCANIRRCFFCVCDPARTCKVRCWLGVVRQVPKDVHLKLIMGPCVTTLSCFLIFLSEKQMNFSAGCIFVSTKNCTNLSLVIASQGCVITSVIIFKCASLVHLVFGLRTFEERLLCYSSKLVRRAFVSGSRRIGLNGPKKDTGPCKPCNVDDPMRSAFFSFLY